MAIALNRSYFVHLHLLQRILACNDLRQIRAGILLAAYLKFLPVFMLLFPGMISHVLYCDCLEETDEAYPSLVKNDFPRGLVGLIVASMIAALMSSLSSTFNSGSTVLTMDIYKRFLNPDASDATLVKVGRFATLALVGLSYLWLPVVGANSSGIFLFLVGVTGRIQPTLAVVMLLGLLWPRTNSEGALAGLCLGLTIGIISLVLNILNSDTCNDDFDNGEPYAHWWACLQFQHVGFFQAGIVSITTVCVSLLTTPPTYENLEGFAFANVPFLENFGFTVPLPTPCADILDDPLLETKTKKNDMRGSGSDVMDMDSDDDENFVKWGPKFSIGGLTVDTDAFQFFLAMALLVWISAWIAYFQIRYQG
jgi:Na+/proline symporter